jgi:anti-sigma B factor antagonist
MQCLQRNQGSVTIVDIAGRLRVDEGVDELRALVARTIAEGRRYLVLNLAGCSYVDSAGLGEMATALVRVRKADGQLVLLNPTERVEALLDITRLRDVFTICRDEPAAVAALQTP